MNQIWMGNRQAKFMPGSEMIMAYNGIVLMPTYDMENDCASQDTWFVVHHTSGLTIAVIDTVAIRASYIATQVAELRDWPMMESFSWEQDVGFADLLAQFPDEIDVAIYEAERHDEWEDVVPFGPNRH